MQNNERELFDVLNRYDSATTQPELSQVWQELLGNRSNITDTPPYALETVIPTLEGDPWSALLHRKGIEVVDLQSVHLQISDQEVDELLQCIPEEHISDFQKETRSDKNSHQ